MNRRLQLYTRKHKKTDKASKTNTEKLKIHA